MDALSSHADDTNARTTTAALLEDIKAGILAITSSDDWERFLGLSARFHDYSLGNVMLICRQCPTATRVAGFNAWRRFGRFVRKGEKGIKILAPLIYKKRDDNDQDAGAGDTPRVIGGFKVVHVWDIAQTDGEPLPGVTRLLEGHERQAELAWVLLHDFATKQLAIPVAVESFGGPANGYLAKEPSPRIVVNAERSPLQRAKTLAHELGHALLHLDDGDFHDRPQKEVEAESVAYCVMNALGVDSGQYTFGYVAGWSNGDVELVTKSAERIHKATQRILKAVL